MALQAAETCRGQLAAARTALEEHRGGLERCVEELNRLQERRIVVSNRGGVPPASSSGRRTAPTPTTSRAPVPGPRAPRAVRTLSAPQVQIAGEKVLVTAKLWNPDEADQTVLVEIALLADGVQKNQETQTLLVPAHGDLAVAAQFHWYGTYEGKTLSGRVRVLR